MKKIFTVSMLLASASAFASSPVPSGEFSGEGVWCFSPNGEWMVSEMSASNCMAIRNLITGEAWGYIYDDTDFGDRWDLPLSVGASNDGTVVGEYNNIPSYWKNGKWNHLKGYIRDGNGTIYATVGGITPDGSMIIGSMGKGGKSVYEDSDVQMTYPCVWYRQDDGSYGDPVWLPNPGVDYFGVPPQYFNLTCVSDDGKVIGAIMRSGQGFHHFPFVYRQEENGEWSCSMLGEDLINPRHLEIPRYPGEYWGPDYPNYENYLSDEELQQVWIDGVEWINSLYEQGITDENTIALLELEFVMQYMSEENRALYEPLLRDFLNQYVPWFEAYESYMAFLEDLEKTAEYFMYNKVLVSHDGKYVYANASKNGGQGAFGPVRFDLETGETTVFERKRYMVICSVSDDYTLLCNTSLDGMAYLYPKNSTTSVSFLDYWKENAGIYAWMEDHMYKQVVVGVSSTGAYQLNDQWCMGRPTATPDMSLVGFACSSEFWYPEPEDHSFVSTFLINPEELSSNGNEENAVEKVSGDSVGSVVLRPDGALQLNGDFTAVEIYDLSGTRLLSVSNPSSVLETSLSRGIYIVRAFCGNDCITSKIAF